LLDLVYHLFFRLDALFGWGVLDVDITSGKKIKLPNQCTVNDALVEALKQGPIWIGRIFPNLFKKATAVFDFLNSVQNQDWIDALKQAEVL
jgi:hypothetical protein